MKIKGSEKVGKYLDLAREEKKRLNLMVMAIPIVVRVFGTVPKNLEKWIKELEIRGRIQTIQTTAMILKIIQNDQ